MKLTVPPRVRPLSISIVGWAGMTEGAVRLAQKLYALLMPDNGTSRGAVDVNWCLEVILSTLLVYGCVALLKGKAWARVGVVGVLVSNLLRGIVLDWFDHWNTFPIDSILVVLGSVALYLPRNGRFFRDTGLSSRLTYQIGTVLCYTVITVLLVPLLSIPAAHSLLTPSASYRLLATLCVLLFFYGVGKALGLILNPSRDVGGILVIASVLSLAYDFSVAIGRVGGHRALWSASDTVPNIDLRVTCMMALMGTVFGAYLIRSTRRQAMG